MVVFLMRRFVCPAYSFGNTGVRLCLLIFLTKIHQAVSTGRDLQITIIKISSTQMTRANNKNYNRYYPTDKIKAKSALLSNRVSIISYSCNLHSNNNIDCNQQDV